MLINDSVIQPLSFGKLSFDEMKVVPFVGFYYKSELLPLIDKEVCKETGGDCYKMIQKYLKIVWFTDAVPVTGWADSEHKEFESHTCLEHEVSEGIYASGLLNICPPGKDVYVMNNWNYVPYTMAGVKIYPNYNEKLHSNETVD